MPRTTLRAAAARADADSGRRWRYLVRNPDFLRDLGVLSELRQRFALLRNVVDLRAERAYSDEMNRIKAKWDLQWLPNRAVTEFPRWNGRQDASAWLDELWGANASPTGVRNRDAVFRPIVTSERIGNRLRLEIDTMRPLDVILAYVEDAVREVLHPPKGRRRRRAPGAPAADLALNVFDRAAKGTTFGRIAADLGKRVSTVKSAYGRACRNIGGTTPLSRRRAPIQGVDWKRFDMTEHLKSCPDCSTTQTADEMCPPLRAWVSRDESGRRESLGHTPKPAQ